MPTLEERVSRLEAIEAIKELKARYFHTCDIKDVDSLRKCFSAGKVLIDYGKIGSFDNREDFLDVFQEKACHAFILDQHHGHNPQVTIEGEHQASGIWDLSFRQLNTQNNMMTHIAGFYHDRFVKEQGEWLIQETVFNVTSTVVTRLEDKQMELVYAGGPV